MAERKPKKPRKAAPKRSRPRGFGALARKLFVWAVIIGVAAPVALVLVFRFVPPPGTILMVQRAAAGKGWDYRWRPLSQISPAMVQAVIAAEDAHFCEHHGFDFEAIGKAMKSNGDGRRIRGGSTISQQTAKNVFLWPQRDWVRKGLEAYFTGLIEVFWGKTRIMEVYLNVAEMGPGVYGAEAAARKHFKTSAKRLTRQQASRLAAILPSPNRYKAVAPGPYVQRQSRRIGGAMGTVREDGLASCVKPA